MLDTRQGRARGSNAREAAPSGVSPAIVAALAREVQALFREARRRRRRRRLTGLASVLLAGILAASAALIWLHRGPSQHEAGGERALAGTAGQPSASAVWVDDASRLHLGTIGADGQLSQRVIDEANAASEPLIAVGRRVYWVDPAGAFVPSLGHWSQVVMVLNLGTRKVAVAGAGQTVFLSADRRYLLMSQTPTSLAEMPVAGGRPRVFTLPSGWYLPGGDGVADPVAGQGLDTANGILVQSKESPGVSARIAVWNPRTGMVEVVGRARAVIDAYTPRGARFSLLAWLPAGCPPPGSCLVKITDTASGAVTTVRSPSAGGFAVGGAFSPDGSRLAVFVNAPSGTSARLALIDPATGGLRVVRTPLLPLGLDYGWARWLSGGDRLIAGTATGGYLVDPATLRSVILRSRKGSVASGINYTAVVISRAR